MERPRQLISSVGVLILFAGIQATLFGEPGFGSIKKRKTTLQIRQPAAVRLAHATIAFRADSASPQYAPVLNSLATELLVEMVANEKTLVQKNNPADAQWVLGLRITGYSVSNPPPRMQTAGNTRWAGSLNVAYQVIDHGGRVHDAGNVSTQYDREFDAAAGSKTVGGVPIPKIPIPGMSKRNPNEIVPHTQDDVKEILIHQVVGKIASKLGNTSENVEVQVATGDDRMNRAADFIDKKLWARALEEMEKTPAYPKPENESYRQYNLGLAYEGMAYEARTANDQKENLYKAQDYYDKALELNAKERYFVETVARTKDSLARYKTLSQMQQQDEQLKQATASAAVTPPASQANPASARSVSTKAAPAQNVSARTVATNTPPPQPARPATAPAPAKSPQKKTIAIADVIEMYSAGVPQDQIIGVVDASPVAFDPLDKDTVLAIAKAKLPVPLQNAMRKKVGAPLLGGAPAQGAAKK
jgi:tetratricopeptide (TPR) repeat protein